MTMTIKNLKTGPSREWGPNGSMTCSVYFDGKRVISFSEYGDGGEAGQEILNDTVYKQLRSWFFKNMDVEKVILTQIDYKTKKEIGKTELPEIALDRAILAHIYELCEKFEEDKLFRRLCKKNTVYINKECGKGEYVIIKQRFYKELAQHIRAKEGNDVIEIINERYLK